MTLAEMVEQTDLETAKLVWSRIHGTNAEDLPFTDWKEVRAVVKKQYPHNDPETIQEVLDKKAASFTDWLYLFETCELQRLRAFSDTETPPHPWKVRIRKIVNALFESITNFTECTTFLKLFEDNVVLSNYNPEAQEKLNAYSLATTEKMVRFASTFEEWQIVYWRCAVEGESRQLAFKQLLETARTLKEWHFIYKQSPTPEIAEQAMTKMVKQAKN